MHSTALFFCVLFFLKRKLYCGIPTKSFLYIFLIKTLCNSITKYNRKTKF